MGNSAQSPPNLDMTDGADASPWIHIPIEQDIPLRLQMIPRSERALMKKQRVCGVIGGFIPARFHRWCYHVEPQSPCAHDRFGLIGLQPDEGVASVVQGALQILEVITTQDPVVAVHQDGPVFVWKRQQQSI